MFAGCCRLLAEKLSDDIRGRLFGRAQVLQVLFDEKVQGEKYNEIELKIILWKGRAAVILWCWMHYTFATYFYHALGDIDDGGAGSSTTTSVVAGQRVQQIDAHWGPKRKSKAQCDGRLL